MLLRKKKCTPNSTGENREKYNIVLKLHYFQLSHPCFFQVFFFLTVAFKFMIKKEMYWTINGSILCVSEAL